MINRNLAIGTGHRNRNYVILGLVNRAATVALNACWYDDRTLGVGKFNEAFRTLVQNFDNFNHEHDAYESYTQPCRVPSVLDLNFNSTAAISQT
jgi:hypothetical protein